MRQGLVEQVNSSLERPFPEPGFLLSCARRSLSLSPTDRVSKTRFLVQRLVPDRVLGLVADELVRQPRIFPKYQPERSVSASVEDAVLCTRPPSARFDPVPLARPPRCLQCATLLRVAFFKPTAVSFASTVSVRSVRWNHMLETLTSARNLAQSHS